MLCWHDLALVIFLATLLSAGSGQTFRFEIQPHYTIALHNRPAQLDCRAIGSSGIYYIWVQENVGFIRSSKRRTVLQNGTLYFSSTDSTIDSGVYFCRAVDDRNQHIDSRKAILRVHYLDNIYVQPVRNNLMEGDTLQLICRAPGALDVRYRWSRNNVTLNGNSRIVLAENRITISHINTNDNGEYKCTASNAFGSRISKVYPFTVKSKPVIVRYPKNAVVSKGQTAMLDCTFKDSEVFVMWYFNGTPIQYGDQIRKLSNNSLQIDDFHGANAGEYLCVGQNAVGVYVANAILRLAYIQSMLKTQVLVSAWGTKAFIACDVPKALPRANFHIYCDGELKSNSSTYIINKIIYKDNNSVCECTAYNSAGVVKGTITLLVKELAQPMFITSPKDTLVSVGFSALFNCDCANANTIEWKAINKMGQELKENTNFKILQNNSLYIDSVTESSQGNYTCKCSFYMISEVSHTATLRVPYIKEFKIRQLSLLTKVGHRVELSCEPPDSLPTAAIIWQTSMGVLSNSDQYLNLNNKLIISKVSLSDNRTFICTAINKAGQQEQYHNLIVIVPPAFSVKPENISVLEGVPIHLDCAAIGNFEPRIWWVKDGRPITSHNHTVIRSNGTLIINAAMVSDAGKYQCIAENSAGTIVASSHVAVKLLLRFTEKFDPVQTVVFANYEHTKTIHCYVAGEQASYVAWLRNGLPYSSDRVSQSNGTLILSRPSINESGYYTCTANDSNTYIEQSINITFAYAPYFIGNDQKNEIRAIVGSSVKLVMSVGGHPEPLLQWEFPVTSSYNNMSNANNSYYEIVNYTLILHEIKEEDSGIYQCLAINSFGSVLFSISITVVHKEPKQVQRETIIITVACAGGYILFMMIAYWYFRNRKENKTYDTGKVGKDFMESSRTCDTMISGLDGDDMCPYEEYCEVVVGNKILTLGDAADKLEFPKQSVRLGDVLGYSKFGPVHKAWAAGITYNEKRTLVTVKQLANHSEALRKEFMQQMNMMLRVGMHENITKLLGVCLQERPQWLIVEYTDKGDLKNYLLSCRSEMEIFPMEIPEHLDYHNKLRICQQVCSALSFMASRNFIHSDVAARNCLIDSSMKVLVTNLSLSKDVYRSEYYTKNSSSTAIPLRWMAPEALFEQSFETESDVWSFGVLMWEVFSLGQMPYYDLKPHEVAEGLRQGTLRLPIPGDSPVEVYGLMQQCWRNRPSSRPRFSELHRKLLELAKLSRNDIIVYGNKCEGAVFCV